MTDSAWTPSLRLDAGGHTVVGKVRRHNEDSFLVDGERGLVAVADGLGGHRAGEHASGMAVRVLGESMQAAREADQEPTLQLLLEAFDRANIGILEDARETPERKGMGTTLTALLLVRGKVLLAHVGDSRAWRIRDGRIVCLTRDHTVVADQLRDGILTPQEAETHQMRHVLSRCLGVHEELQVDLAEGDVSVDDVYVVASDGLVNALEDDYMVELIGAVENADVASELLVNRACERNGQDNITAVVVRCRDASA